MTKRKPALSRDGVSIEEIARQLAESPYCVPPPTLTAEVRKRAASIAAREAARIEKQLLESLQPPSKERREWEFDRMVRILLQHVCDEQPAEQEPPMPQSQKLLLRWSLVRVGRRRLSWTKAYAFASAACGDSRWAGSARTMKEAYQLVERARRAVRAAEQRQAKRSRKAA